MDSEFKQRNSALLRANRYRTLVTLASGQGSHVTIDGREFVNLCSNDYLALAGDDRLKRAAMEAAAQWGTGSGASRLLSGNLTVHEDLEQAAATLVGKPSALCFSSGYAANVGLLSSIAGKGDVIFSDERNHASLIDGCRLSRAGTIVYRHLDLADLAQNLSDHRGRFEKAFVVTESYFSMDGDIAPLFDISEICQSHDASLIVDEAHGIGVFGEGRGICFNQGITERVLTIIGTLGKAIGSQGAFVAGSESLRSYLINHARSFIFSTALSPPATGAALAGIGILMEEGRTLCKKLHERIDLFRQSLNGLEIPLSVRGNGPIFPVIYQEEQKALLAATDLFKNGVLVRAIRPPSVPVGESRIRFSICVAHTLEDIEKTRNILAACR